MVHYTAVAKASLDKVWEHLLFKIEHPEHFVPGVSNVVILEKTATYVLRQMDVLLDGKTITLQEKITFDPYTVRFTLLEHPFFEGYVDNEARYISETATEITYTIAWRDKHTQEAVQQPEMVKNAVVKTISYIENTL